LLYLADRPEKLIISSIPVPPLPIRPSVRVDGGTTRFTSLHSIVFLTRHVK